jgi:hypothetical protein
METTLVSASSVAGNVNSTHTVPDNMAWELLYGQVSLTTDATVANRRVQIAVLDASDNVITDYHAGAVVTASLSNQHHELMQGVFRETTFVGSALQVPIGMDLIAQQGWKIRVSIDAGVAGDSYNVKLVVKEHR